jgi:hypothetical protein
LAFSAQNIEVVDKLPGWAPIQLWSYNGTASTQYPSIGVAVVPQQLSIRSLSAVPLAVMSGQPVTLSWRTMGAARATLSANGGTRPVDPTSGSFTDKPTQTTVYTLSAEGAGSVIYKQITVFVQQA